MKTPQTHPEEPFKLCRAARNLSFQDKLPGYGVVDRLASFKGQALIGTALIAPMRSTPVHVLPLLTISMGKGTGVVTSVPSDSPADYVALQVISPSQTVPNSCS